MQFYQEENGMGVLFLAIFAFPSSEASALTFEKLFGHILAEAHEDGRHLGPRRRTLRIQICGSYTGDKAFTISPGHGIHSIGTDSIGIAIAT